MTLKRAAPTDWLTVFEINLTSASNSLYANGRQQARVSTKVEPRQGKTISDAEMASLCVVELDNDGVYVPVPSSETPSTLWWFSDTQNQYDFYSPASAPAPRGDNVADEPVTSTAAEIANIPVSPDNTSFTADAVRTRDFYLMTKSAGGEVIQLRGQITRDDGSVYVTDDVFTTFVDLTSVKPPTYSATQDYEVVKTLISGSEDSGIFVYEHVLGHTLYPFLNAQVDPPGMIQWDDKNPIVTHASNVGHAGPGESDVIYEEAIKLPAAFMDVRVAYVSAPTPGKVTLLLQGAIDIPYDSIDANTHNGPCSINAIDSNGNDHRLKIKFQGETGFDNRVNFTLLNG